MWIRVGGGGPPIWIIIKFKNIIINPSNSNMANIVGTFLKIKVLLDNLFFSSALWRISV